MLTTSIANASQTATEHAQVASNDTLNLETLSLFRSFIAKYGKVYPEDTFHDKYRVFLSNLQLINRRNEEEARNGGNAVHGITYFADMTAEEFTNQYLSAGFSDDFVGNAETVSVDPYVGTATSANWISSYTTPVRDQGAIF